MEGATAYPLSWPIGWPRTPALKRKAAPWAKSWTVERARSELARQLELAGASEQVLSTNLALRLDGKPYSNQPLPQDCGVSVWFKLKGKDRVLACDRWHRVEHNIRALALHVGAIRGMDRWGVGSIEQAFTGYAALPERASPLSWAHELGLEGIECPSRDQIEQSFRALVKQHHPDKGGDATRFRLICEARDLALAQIGGAS